MIKALGHHVLVRVPEVENVSQGGIVIPDTVRDTARQGSEMGIIIDVGPTAWKAEGLGGSDWAKVGDKVWFAKYVDRKPQRPER
jgi:co-chaperonin GroES (HSP10)